MIWLIGLGGSFGAVARYLVSILFAKKGSFPIATWFVNIIGSFILGLIVHFHLTNQIQDWVYYMFGSGFCGGFTTFSTFGTETIKLVQSNQLKTAFTYVLSSLIVGGIAAAIGLSL